MLGKINELEMNKVKCLKKLGQNHWDVLKLEIMGLQNDRVRNKGFQL